jgi:hypothetical protein
MIYLREALMTITGGTWGWNRRKASGSPEGQPVICPDPALGLAIAQQLITFNPAAHVELDPACKPKALVWTCGLPPVRLHDLRHGAATLMLPAGVDVKVVSDTLGHRDVSFTHAIPQGCDCTSP